MWGLRSSSKSSSSTALYLYKWRAKMQKPVPAGSSFPYSTTVNIHFWRLTVHSSPIILFYFDRLYKHFFLPFPFIFLNFFSLLTFFSVLSLCSPYLSSPSLFSIALPSPLLIFWWCLGWRWAWVLVSTWWWSRGCGCGVADLGLGVAICDFVSAWWWSRGCGCGVAGGLRREARNEEREKKFK